MSTVESRRRILATAAAALLGLGVLAACSDGGDSCESLRSYIVIAKQNAQKADAKGDTATADAHRSLVDDRARKARAKGCDISDLVGDNVGR